MSYLIIKAFKIDLKNLSITGKLSPNNVIDSQGNRPVSDFNLTFQSRDELEQELVKFANGFLDGEYRFPKTHSFAKRVEWLIENGYGRQEKEIHNWYNDNIDDTQEIRDYLSGKNKIKFKSYGIIVRYNPNPDQIVRVRLNYNATFKVTASKAKLIMVGDFSKQMTEEEIVKASKGKRCLSKLSERELKRVQSVYKDFLEEYNAEVIEL